MKYAGIVSIVFLMSFSLQDKKQKVSQKEIDAAINKGVKWLKQDLEACLKNKPNSSKGREELILYTLIHTGSTEKEESFKKLLETVLKRKPSEKETYFLVLDILSFVSYDQKKYRDRIIEGAQTLVDYQNKDGGWGYRGVTKFEKEILETKDKKVRISRQKWGSGDNNSDNSNSQYAAIGIRACHEAGIEIDKEVIKLAKEYYEKNQCDDGGWNYKTVGDSYGSMCIGGLGALASYCHILKEDIKKDEKIKKAIDWLTKNFTVDRNPCGIGDQDRWDYYFLYGLERAGAVTYIEKFGTHDWYQEGAQYLVRNQEKDGRWKNKYQVMDALNTCFAILFLKRATEELITGQ